LLAQVEPCGACSKRARPITESPPFSPVAAACSVLGNEDLIKMHNKNYDRPPRAGLKEQINQRAKARLAAIKAGGYDSSSDTEDE